MVRVGIPLNDTIRVKTRMIIEWKSEFAELNVLVIRRRQQERVCGNGQICLVDFLVFCRVIGKNFFQVIANKLAKLPGSSRYPHTFFSRLKYNAMMSYQLIDCLLIS